MTGKDSLSEHALYLKILATENIYLPVSHLSREFVKNGQTKVRNHTVKRLENNFFARISQKKCHFYQKIL